MGDPQPLLHAVRVVADLGPGPLSQADGLQDLVDPRFVHAAVQRAEEPQVPASAHVQVESGDLDEPADVPQRLAPVVRHAMVEDLGVPAGRVDEPHDHADGRGLAGSVRPQEPEDVAPAHREVEAVDRSYPFEALRESVSRQHDGLLCRRRTDGGADFLRLRCEHPGTPFCSSAFRDAPCGRRPRGRVALTGEANRKS